MLLVAPGGLEDVTTPAPTQKILIVHLNLQKPNFNWGPRLNQNEQTLISYNSGVNVSFLSFESIK